METRSAKRKKLQIHLDHDAATPYEDRISDLPNDILHHILHFLPISSVAQTSILSKRWRDLWYSHPDLDFTTATSFTNNIAASSYIAQAKNVNKIERYYVFKGFKYVDQILGLLERHSGIRVLKFRAFLSFSRLNRLIRSAVRHSVQELDVEVSTFDYFNFPRSVINCETLKHFRLKSLHPGFRFPPLEVMKNGFKSLCILSLSRAILHDQPFILDLFTDSSFPLLKNLHLEACFGLKHLRINCPGLKDVFIQSCFHLQDLEISVQKLERLRVTSCFDAYSISSRVSIDCPMLTSIFWSNNAITEASDLKNLTSLQEAYVGFFILHEATSFQKIPSFLSFLSGLSHCHQSLTLDSQCIEMLWKNKRFAGVSLSPFNKLKSLEVITSFNKRDNPELANLFKNCPNIHTIIVKISSNSQLNEERRRVPKELWEMLESGEENYWESQIRSLTSFLHHLKVVKIRGFMECANDISLVKFLLKNGKGLQEIFLSCATPFKHKDSLLREKIRSQIVEFCRASSKAKIAFQ